MAREETTQIAANGLRALIACDRAVESWLHNKVAPAYDTLKSNPSLAVSPDEVRSRLGAELAKKR
jgi:antitoxin ParD1/3/4